MEVRCALCGRWFKTAQGRRGHLNFYHGQAIETPYTSAFRYAIYQGKNGVKMQKEEKIKDKQKNKASNEEMKKKKGKPEEEISEEEEMKKKIEKPEPEIRDVMPKDKEEAVERYIANIPEIFVDKYQKYVNIHLEDDELTRRYPDDFDKSVRVLPLEKDGKRSLEMVSTDKEKTQDFHRFLKEGKFRFENEDIEGLGRERIMPLIRRHMRRRMRERLER